MSRRGYFERQSGIVRARLALPGEDVDDPNLSPNKIAFDSQALGVLSVFQSGVGVIPDRSAYDAGVWVASGWGLPYVPLCMIRYSLFAPPDLSGSLNIPSSFVGYEGQVKVTPDGIWIKSNHSGWISAGMFPFYVKWVAYRLPV